MSEPLIPRSKRIRPAGGIISSIPSEIFTKFITLYTDATLGDKTMRESITQKITMARFINDFFLNLNMKLLYIRSGFYGFSINPPTTPNFLRYPKYIQVKTEYDKSNLRSIYDEINEGQDYDRYKLMNPGSISLTSSRGQRPRGLIKNYMPPEQHRLCLLYTSDAADE